MPVFDRKTGNVIVPPDMSGLILCVGGNARFHINDNVYNISYGTLCLVSPLRFIEMDSASADCKLEMICDCKDLFYPVAKYALNAIKNNYLKNPCQKLDEKQFEKFMFFVDMIKEKQHMIAKEQNETNIILLQQNIASLKQIAVEDFLIDYVLKQSNTLNKLSENENLALDFCRLLLQNYTTHRDVEWYAKQANLSTAYFSQTIRQQIGFTPSLIIKQIVVANAKMLLSQPLSIKEVAVKLKFANQFAFLKYFKSGTGMSPSEYRKREGMCW